jgi:hypothetical protein
MASNTATSRASARQQSARQQIAFRYRVSDSATGVTRRTAQRLAKYLGVDETQAIHRALSEMANKLLPQYQADDGVLSASQVRQIKKQAVTGPKKSVRSSLVSLDIGK